MECFSLCKLHAWFQPNPTILYHSPIDGPPLLTTHPENTLKILIWFDMNSPTSSGTLADDLCTNSDTDRICASQIKMATFHHILTTLLILTKVSEIEWKFQPILMSPIKSLVNKYWQKMLPIDYSQRAIVWKWT